MWSVCTQQCTLQKHVQNRPVLSFPNFMKGLDNCDSLYYKVWCKEYRCVYTTVCWLQRIHDKTDPHLMV